MFPPGCDLGYLTGPREPIARPMESAQVARYLAVPAQMAPAMFIVVFSLLFALAAQASVMGIPLMLLLFFGFCKYSFALLDAVTEGAQAPTLSVEMMNPVEGGLQSLVVLILVAGAFYGTGAASYWMSPIVCAIVGLGLLGVLIAIVAVEGASGSLAQALNPRHWWTMVTRLGADYLLIVACAAAFFLLGLAVLSWPALPSIIAAAILLYGWLAIFALTGGVLRERRHELGLDVMEETDPAKRSLNRAIQLERDHVVDRIYAEWRNGAHKNAWNTVMLQLTANTDPLEQLGWLYERTCRWPDQRMADRLARERIARLLPIRRHGEVLDLIDARLKVNPDFRAEASSDLIRWVQLARDGGHRRLARALLKDFERLYPKDASQSQVDVLRHELER